MTNNKFYTYVAVCLIASFAVIAFSMSPSCAACSKKK